MEEDVNVIMDFKQVVEVKIMKGFFFFLGECVCVHVWVGYISGGLLYNLVYKLQLIKLEL